MKEQIGICRFTQFTFALGQVDCIAKIKESQERACINDYASLSYILSGKFLAQKQGFGSGFWPKNRIQAGFLDFEYQLKI